MINFTVVKTVLRIGKDKGKERYYAKSDKPRVISYEDAIRDIAEMSSLTTGDVRNAIDRLAYYLQRELAEGNTVQLGQIGTFRVSAQGKYIEKAQDVHAGTIKPARIQFVLNSYLKSALGKLRYTVDNPFTRKTKPSDGSGSGQSGNSGNSGSQSGGSDSGNSGDQSGQVGF